MNNKMDWQQLLSLKKYKDKQDRPRNEQDATRLGFEVDYDRIIFSSPFRSLQDKTQVIPHSQTDFVHTRLTHSLEVSVVGRSLGRLAGLEILKKYPELAQNGYTLNDFGAIVAAACLCHDIGNPPFGHSGEKAIGDFFKHGGGKKFQEKLTEKEWQDLIDFEGNANGFRILTTSSKIDDGGMRISYATLGAFMKYPKESLPKKPTSAISDKKYGFFQADKHKFEDVAKSLGLIQKNGEDTRYHRHPLAFLVEAADDICYTIIDFEDGINLGWIPEEIGIPLLENIVVHINQNVYKHLTSVNEKVAYLRAVCVGQLINASKEVFLAHEEEILQGDFDQSLTALIPQADELKKIIQLSVEKIYQSNEVVVKEIKGYQVLHTLLERVITAVENKNMQTHTHIDSLLLKMIPARYTDTNKPLYERLLNVCTYISLLTDGKALEMYEMMKR